MNYKLNVLSPLHIGCGEKYSSLNFVFDNGKMFCIDSDHFISAIGENRSRTFVEWIETCSDNLDKLESRKNAIKRNKDDASKNEVKRINSELRKQKQAFTLKKFVESNRINLKQLIGKALYSAEVQHGVYEDSEINPFIKQLNHPYLPGTEIKGAIRTAVLYGAICDDKALYEWLKIKLEKFHRDYTRQITETKNNIKPNTRVKNELVKAMEKIESEFQEQVLCCKPKDAKYDVMKYLQVSDSELLDADKFLSVSYVKPFNIKNIFSVYYEYIKPNSEIKPFIFQLENSRILKLEKMGFSDKQKNTVSGIDLILQYCHRFSNDLLDEEISFFSAHKKTQIVTHLKSIKKLNKPESPVLRIGKDEGYNSLTVGLAVKKLDPDLYENVLIHATKNKSYDSSHGGPLPKSRKIVYWNGKETTAGWVQLIPENDSTSQDHSIDTQTEQTARKQNPATPSDVSMLADKFRVTRKRS
jgi:CRISPR-associated protein Csm5